MKLYYLVCVFLHHVGNKLIDLIFWVCTYMLVFINHVWNIFQQRSLPCQKNLRPQQKKLVWLLYQITFPRVLNTI